MKRVGKQWECFCCFCTKENRPEHVQAWGGKNNAQNTERKKPYGNQTLSNASMKYRANKSKGAPTQEAASAAYKARMRLKKKLLSENPDNPGIPYIP